MKLRIEEEDNCEVENDERMKFEDEDDNCEVENEGVDEEKNYECEDDKYIIDDIKPRNINKHLTQTNRCRPSQTLRERRN